MAAAGTADNTRLWDTNTGVQRCELNRGKMTISPDFSPDGNTLVGAGKAILLWTTRN
jgi:WD40 repeat protein